MTSQDLGPFKIIHLSDLHLTADDSTRRTEPKLFGRLTGMNAAFRRIAQSRPVQSADLVLVTGDVTDQGEIEAWRTFWDATRSAGIDVKKVMAVPGNHDVCCLGARLPWLDPGAASEQDSAKAVAGLTIGAQPVTFPWAKVQDHLVVVFGLNSNNLGNSSAVDNALGKIGFHQLESFARLLRKHRDVPVKIVALHHSPNLPKPETMKKRFGKDLHSLNRLFSAVPQDQRRALRLLCITHGVRLILHGHVHLGEDRRVNGVRIVGAPPTTEPFASDAGTMAYRLWSYTINRSTHRVSVSPVCIPV